jgi:ferric-dicitrate binding protein FerR (iron transport regulator)
MSDKQKMTNSIDAQAMQDYLQGKMTPAQANAFEQMMQDDDFVDDAVEGIQSMDQPSKANSIAEQLNRELYLQLHQKKQRRERRKMSDMKWTIAALVFLVICLFFLYYYMKVKGLQ